MSETSSTGSFWLCPQCHKHVSTRRDLCQCGVDRTKLPDKVDVVSSAPQVVPSARPNRRNEPSGWWMWWIPGVLLLGGLGYWAYRSVVAPAPASGESRAANQPGVVILPVPPGQKLNTDPRTWTLPTPPSQPLLGAGSFGALPPTARQLAEGLAAKLAAGATPSSADVAQAEVLFAQFPAEPMTGRLLQALVLAAADKLISGGAPAQARAILDRGVAALPNDPDIQTASLRVRFDMSDWPAAEAMARQILRRAPTAPEARTVLALALAAQGNDTEALRAIYAALSIGATGPNEKSLRQMRDQIERRLWATSRCDQSQLPDPSDDPGRVERFLAILSSCQGGGSGQRLAHFSVTSRRLGRDIDIGSRLRLLSAESVSRDVLAVLERQYSALESALGHKMRHPIPVVILEDAAFHYTTGAPLWAGGQYDNDDATITLPMGFFALESSPDSDWEAHKDQYLERVLVHETAHAFIADMTGSLAPRDIHEGLASFLEREVTRDRADSAGEIAAAFGREAVERYPDDRGAQQRFLEATLGRLLEDVRTEGNKHVGTGTTVYIGGEMFVQYLVRQRSMAGIQDLLNAMGESQSVEGAFKRVYGAGHDGTRRAWLDWLRMQWGVRDARR